MKYFWWILILFLGACESHEPQVLNSAAHFPESVYDLSQLNSKEIELGKKLFFDPILSRDNSISCASCHIPSMAFTHHGHDVSHGIDDLLGKRNTLPLFNLAWYKNFFWDGGVFHLNLTPIAAITNEVEMDETIPNVITKLRKDSEYPKLFKKTYGTDLIIDQEFLGALAQYLASLQSTNSKYDQVIKGKATFTEDEAKGYALFQKNCSSCHQEPTFRSEGFFNTGLPIGYYDDLGRYDVTALEEDKYKFRVPSLRNLSYTKPYMHDGRYKTLERVLQHYRNGMVDYPNLDPAFKNTKLGIDLNDKETEQILLFLNTLNDPSFIDNVQK